MGLRGHYHCTVLASRLMVQHQKGLIVNVSSMGGLKYYFNVAYGVGKNTLFSTLTPGLGKAGCDRMAADCGHELQNRGVTMVSLWPGAVKTEYMQVRLLSILM